MEVGYFQRSIVPALGDFELDDLTRAHIQKYVNGLAKRIDPKTGKETGVRRQGFWERLQLNLSEIFAHLLFDIKQLVCGIANVAV
jgi:hypothetical protein